MIRRYPCSWIQQPLYSFVQRYLFISNLMDNVTIHNINFPRAVYVEIKESIYAMKSLISLSMFNKHLKCLLIHTPRSLFNFHNREYMKQLYDVVNETECLALH